MKVIEFIRRKNEILKEISGLDLVPEDQIFDMEAKPLYYTDSDCGICPYCVEYMLPAEKENEERELEDDEYLESICSGCPMFEAGNGCDVDDNYDESTYQDMARKLNCSLTDIEKVCDLVDEFNESNGFPRAKRYCFATPKKEVKQ